MLTRMARRIIDLVLDSDADEQQRILCEYGCEVCLYTIFSTAGLIILGAALNSATEAIIMIAVFYACQSSGGGYHASSHIKCFLIMAAGLMLGIMLLGLSISRNIYIVTVICSAMVLVMIPIQLHPNKDYLCDKAASLSGRSRRISIFIAAGALIVTLIYFDRAARSCCIALLLSSISRIAAFVESKARC